MDAMEKKADDTLSPILPDCPIEGTGSAEVETLIPETPPSAGPRVSPASVTFTDELAPRVPELHVTTIEVEVIDVKWPMMPPLMVTVGAAADAKKLVGYANVMLPPGFSKPPAVVVNANVAVTFVLPATRALRSIANIT